MFWNYVYFTLDSLAWSNTLYNSVMLVKIENKVCENNFCAKAQNMQRKFQNPSPFHIPNTRVE
jgi:hypothetical protein